jgi:streptogramin lyase
MKTTVAVLAAVTAVAAAWGASAAAGPRVSLVGKAPPPTVGKSWTAKLAVRPASYRGTVRLVATGPGRIEARASGGHGSYRARLVFSQPGRWKLTARAGGTTSQLGVVTVRKPAPVPVTFTWPTSVAAEPGGSLLVVENGAGRLVRVNPATGRVTQVAVLTKPYAVRRAPSGSILVTDGGSLLRIDGSRAPVPVDGAGADIGPIAIAPTGDVYYTTETQLWKLPGASGPRVRIAPQAQLSAPHGLTVGADGTVLVSDTGNHRILRVDPEAGTASTFASVDNPRGLATAADGTIYAVDADAKRVLHLSATGGRLGFAGPPFGDPYDLALAPGGVIYVVDTAQSGRIRRVAPDGTATTVSRP